MDECILDITLPVNKGLKINNKKSFNSPLNRFSCLKDGYNDKIRTEFPITPLPTK